MNKKEQRKLLREIIKADENDGLYDSIKDISKEERDNFEKKFKEWIKHREESNKN